MPCVYRHYGTAAIKKPDGLAHSSLQRLGNSPANPKSHRAVLFLSEPQPSRHGNNTNPQGKAGTLRPLRQQQPLMPAPSASSNIGELLGPRAENSTACRIRRHTGPSRGRPAGAGGNHGWSVSASPRNVGIRPSRQKGLQLICPHRSGSDSSPLVPERPPAGLYPRQNEPNHVRT